MVRFHVIRTTCAVRDRQISMGALVRDARRRLNTIDGTADVTHKQTAVVMIGPFYKYYMQIIVDKT